MVGVHVPRACCGARQPYNVAGAAFPPADRCLWPQELRPKAQPGVGGRGREARARQGKVGNLQKEGVTYDLATRAAFLASLVSAREGQTKKPSAAAD